jgi:hypothetical protein
MKRYMGFGLILFLIMSVCLTGCAPLLIGSGIVAGYMVTKDSVSGNIDTSFNRLWDTSMYVLRERGEIIDYRQDSGWIKAVYSDNSVTINIKELTRTTYNLRVKARKAVVLANTALAQEIFTKIISTLESGSQVVK